GAHGSESFRIKNSHCEVINTSSFKKLRVVDPIGCGDTFFAIFGINYFKTKDFKFSAKRANIEMIYQPIDMAVRSDMHEFLTDIQPELIINAAAYTNVDKCEVEREQCWNTNVRAVENIAESDLNPKTIIVHISTDYVFDGENPPYREKDKPNPRGNYARSKMASENIVRASQFEYVIVRTQVLYGTGNRLRPNFVTWIIEQLRNNKKIKVVTDQIGNPTYNHDVSEGIYRLLQTENYGIFHISGSESINRFDFAVKIASVFNLDEKLIESTTTSNLEQKAPRPANSTFVLDKLYNNIGWLPHDAESGLKLLKKEMNAVNE
ncbi:MAG: SDR family oxidoreductase, partial [Calditrichaceae bacterium]